MISQKGLMIKENQISIKINIFLIIFFLFSGNRYFMEADTVKQEQRTVLRERFLRMCAAITGQSANICMQEKTNVQCILGHIDIDVQHVQVKDLLTPMGKIPHAVLRLNDVISIQIPDLKHKEYWILHLKCFKHISKLIFVFQSI